MRKYFAKTLTGVLMFLCLFCSQLSFAQSKVNVSGIVSDSNSEPLVGVNILEQGTTNGTMTDIDGKWSLSVTPGATLVVSCVGFNSQELKVSSAGTYNVTLEDDTTALDEVVVVGFGTQKKVNLTGSVAVASSEDIEARPVNDLPSALQGLLPGLQLTHSEGGVESSFNVRIRGTGTIGSGSSDSPLILIDGMQGDINTLNPQDVENISVLKDAASASIYGSRAAFGVILITTKRGAAEKAKVSYNNNFRFSSPLTLPRQMDSYTFAVYFNEASRNQGKNPQFSDETMQRMLDFQAAGGTNKGGLLVSTDGKYWGKPGNDPYTTGFANTDWYAELYKNNSFAQEHNLSVRGGAKAVQYYLSLGFLDSDGLLRYGNDHNQRFNVSANINTQITDWASLSYNLRYITNKTHRPSKYINGMYNDLGRQCWPNLPIYDENGYFTGNGSGGNLAQRLEESGFSDNQVNTISQQAALLLEPIKNWRTHVEFNYRNNASNNQSMDLPLQDHDVEGNLVPTTENTTISNSNSRSVQIGWNIYSDYTFTLGKDHNFKALLGFQSDESNSENFSVSRTGVQDPTRPYLSLTTGLGGDGNPTTPVISGGANDWRTIGFFGRINYDYKGKYLFEANLRYDGSSRFRQDSRWTWAPSFSAGWNIAQEEFFANAKSVVNMLKLRLSYGTLSNQNTHSNYPTYRTMSLSSSAGGWIINGNKPNIARVGDLISSGLTWEKVNTYNGGLDWGMFKNRFTGSFEYFQRFTNNMVGPAKDLPSVLGLSAPAANNCDLKTVGWELNFTWKDRLKSGFGYSISGNISDSRTIILSYPDNSTHSISSYNEGHEMGEIWGFETIDIARTDEDANYFSQVDQSALGSQWAKGDIMYRDLNGDGKITKGAQTLDDHGDLKIIGNSNSHYFFGLNLAADYKGFDFKVFLQGVLKHDIWMSTEQFWGVRGSSIWNSCGFYEHGDYYRAEPVGLAGHEIPANINSYFPRPIFSTSKNLQTQTMYLQDASYIRLKNLQAGYTLPQNLTGKIGVSRARIFVSVDNLLTGTNLMKLFDPETISGGRGNAYPFSRTWSFGVSLNF